MADNYNTEELNAILSENIEAIVRNITNNDFIYYEYDDDQIVTVVVESLTFVLIKNVSSTEEAVSITEIMDHEDDCATATIPEDATSTRTQVPTCLRSGLVGAGAVPTLDDVQKGDDNVINPVDPLFLATDTSTIGDAPFEKLEHDETTPISEDGPLPDAVEDVVSGAVGSDKEMTVPNSDERNVDRLDTEVASVKCNPPRRNRFSAGWKRVKRIFCALCCCRPKTVRRH